MKSPQQLYAESLAILPPEQSVVSALTILGPKAILGATRRTPMETSTKKKLSYVAIALVFLYGGSVQLSKAFQCQTCLDLLAPYADKLPPVEKVETPVVTVE